MTSNAEREFPAPFLRRCVRLFITPPDKKRLAEIVMSQLRGYAEKIDKVKVAELIDEFDLARKENAELSTDQLINTIFLTIALPGSDGRTFSEIELAAVRNQLMRPLGGPIS